MNAHKFLFILQRFFLQTLMSAPSETHVETEPAPMWSEASSARARRALSLVQWWLVKVGHSHSRTHSQLAVAL